MGERTKAVIAVHMFGYPMELDELAKLCEERGVALIEDCCESAGATFADGSSVGTRGATGVFSFFAKTQLPVGEGGLVVTDDEAAASRMRLLRSHAMTSVTWDRHRGHAETYDITDVGYNYRIDEPRAAMARAHLDELDGRLEKLRANVRTYRERLAGVDGVEIPFDEELVARAGHFAFPVAVPDNATRHQIRMELCGQMIQTTFYPALTTLEIYGDAGRANPCPRAEDFASRHLAMPLSCTMDAADVEFACGALEAALTAAVPA
jgi:dTDP-4-amino-4,6-dideoxygalactose transaminase